ncbi:MAG: hypothetical protein MI741_10870, partial [Rhodospirillales bacterium]|nr:hypothetical protein [Rhodospirillales bacterium]
MSISIDTATLSWVMAVLYGSLSLALAFVWRVHRTIEGPPYWVSAMAMHCLGLILLIMAVSLPAAVSVVVACTLLVGGAALILRGIRAFQGIEQGG